MSRVEQTEKQDTCRNRNASDSRRWPRQHAAQSQRSPCTILHAQSCVAERQRRTYRCRRGSWRREDSACAGIRTSARRTAADRRIPRCSELQSATNSRTKMQAAAGCRPSISALRFTRSLRSNPQCWTCSANSWAFPFATFSEKGGSARASMYSDICSTSGTGANAICHIEMRAPRKTNGFGCATRRRSQQMPSFALRLPRRLATDSAISS